MHELFDDDPLGCSMINIWNMIKINFIDVPDVDKPIQYSLLSIDDKAMEEAIRIKRKQDDLINTVVLMSNKPTEPPVPFEVVDGKQYSTLMTNPRVKIVDGPTMPDDCGADCTDDCIVATFTTDYVKRLVEINRTDFETTFGPNIQLSQGVCLNDSLSLEYLEKHKQPIIDVDNNTLEDWGCYYSALNRCEVGISGVLFRGHIPDDVEDKEKVR